MPPFDFLRFFAIELCQTVVSIAMSSQKFIELGMDGLSITVFGALNEQCRDPGRDGGGTLPTKRCRIEDHPSRHVHGDHNEGYGM